MRHTASLVAAMEGISRPAFRIAKELAQNSRSGLTVRFLSKKLELPEEEIEYLVDVNHRLFFFDITKVRLAVEGPSAVKRILAGLENHGDVSSLFRLVKELEAHDLRQLEDKVGLEEPGGKKRAAQALLDRYYARPESVVEYVASRGFSPRSQELFDVVWQSKEGVVPVPKLRTIYDGADFEVEQALWELFRGYALFEMFRFDPEDRLVRAAGLLSEIRQWRESRTQQTKGKAALHPCRGKTCSWDVRGLDFSDRVCRLVGAIAARPARLRADGELFREDRRRLSETVPEEYEPSLPTVLWAAQGMGWLARVDDELQAADLEALIRAGRLERHRLVYDWYMAQGEQGMARRMFVSLLEDLEPDAAYAVTDFIAYAMRVNSEDEQPVLRPAGGHWHYVSPSAAPNAERLLARALEESFLWLGLVDRSENEQGAVFRLTPLGRSLLSGEALDKLSDSFAGEPAELVVQPNFDVVVSGQDVDPLLTVPLEQFARRSSMGQAAVYTLTKESFTRAVQDGHDAEAFVRFLLEHNRDGGLPTNVLTTLDGWRGGMKRVRIRTMHVLETEDPFVLADLLHRKRLSKHFAELDPDRMVSFGKISKGELAKVLEKEGFVVE
jgi:hypothetical protein